MIEVGEFSYKKNTYEFIEKYSIAMLDPWGYAEIVIHPPPLNFFTVFLTPFTVKKTLMKKASRVFAKTVFWGENIFFFLFFLAYEFVLVPFIFFRIIYNIMRLASFFRMLYLVLVWLCVGPIILFMGVLKDTFYFLKILMNYQEKDQVKREKEEADFKQDKIVIYNEMVDVLRSILHIFKKKADEEKQKKQIMGRAQGSLISRWQNDDGED